MLYVYALLVDVSFHLVLKDYIDQIKPTNIIALGSKVKIVHEGNINTFTPNSKNTINFYELQFHELECFVIFIRFFNSSLDTIIDTIKKL